MNREDPTRIVGGHEAANRLAVAIAGGGIGGLAAALALAARGARVSVFEKRTDRLEEGAGIQLGPNGSRILRDLGVLDRLAPKAATPERLVIRDGPSGRALARLPLGDWIARRHGAPYLTCHRADLHRALDAAVGANAAITIHRGLAVARYEDAPGATGVQLISETDQNLGRFDLAVAADGLRSRLRRQFAPAAPTLAFTGKSAARTVLPLAGLPPAARSEIRPDAVGIWLSPNGHVVHYPVNAGRDLAVVVIRNGGAADESWATNVETAWVQAAVATFAPPAKALIAAAGPYRKWALYGVPPLPHFASRRVALLGDAAHPVLPFFAQGAVLALEDAATLGACLAPLVATCRAEHAGRGTQPNAIARADLIATALCAYDDRRRPRAEAVQKASRDNGRIYHLSGPMRLARNLTLSVAPPERLMARYDWLYGWKVA